MVTSIKGNDTSTFGGDIQTSSGIVLSNTPIFSAVLSGNQTVSSDVNTKIQFNTEITDTDSGFNTTNYDFTVPTGKGGIYFIAAGVHTTAGNTNLWNSVIHLRVNGTIIASDYWNLYNNPINAAEPKIARIFTLNAGDVLDIYSSTQSANAASVTVSSGVYTYFSGYKLIG